METEVLDHARATLDGSARWNAEGGFFRIPLHGNREFGAVVVLDQAPLPLDHLDRGSNNAKSQLGIDLQQRLEYEVNQAILRGAHQVATGIALLTHAETRDL